MEIAKGRDVFTHISTIIYNGEEIKVPTWGEKRHTTNKQNPICNKPIHIQQLERRTVICQQIKVGQRKLKQKKMQ